MKAAVVVSIRMVMAWNGQFTAHRLQPVHRSGSCSTKNFSHLTTSRLKRRGPHTATHRPQPVHRWASTSGSLPDLRSPCRRPGDSAGSVLSTLLMAWIDPSVRPTMDATCTAAERQRFDGERRRSGEAACAEGHPSNPLAVGRTSRKLPRPQTHRPHRPLTTSGPSWPTRRSDQPPQAGQSPWPRPFRRYGCAPSRECPVAGPPRPSTTGSRPPGPIREFRAAVRFHP